MNTDNLSPDYYRVRAEVCLDAVRENVGTLKQKLRRGVKVCAVIKADAYGHGAVKVAKALSEFADFFAVATIDEAMELREAGIMLPILVLGFTCPEKAPLAALNSVRLTVFDGKYAAALSKELIKKPDVPPLKFHIKIETGMNRIGFKPCEKSLEVIKRLSGLPAFDIEGAFTHFYLADGEELRQSEDQLRLFNSFCGKIASAGVPLKIRHCSNSAAASRMPSANLDMVRLGISMYGLYPSEFVTDPSLSPALSLKSHIIMIKEIEKGESVGYGAAFTAAKKTKIATVPVGYADGYMRSLSNKGYVLIRGKKARITGRICMDMFMADVTDIEGVSAGDEAVLIGRQGENMITMEEISALAGSFNYEFACGIGKRVPRLYV